MTRNRLLKRLILTALLLLLTASASDAITAGEMVREQNFTIDPVALDLMESLGELTHLDAAFLKPKSKPVDPGSGPYRDDGKGAGSRLRFIPG